MTTLYQRIKDAQLQARRTKAAIDLDLTVEINLLTTLLGELETNSKKTGNAVTDADVISTLKKYAVNAELTLANLDATDVHVSILHTELDVISSFLPLQLTEDQIRYGVQDYLTLGGEKSLKAIMQYFKENYAGQYDGKFLSSVAKQALQ